MDHLEIERDFTHPFQTYPQFLRYLTGAQKKIVDALLMHGGARGHAFPSNARLSLITGMGRQTIQNLKGELCRLGVLTKKPNRKGSYTYTVITTWKREEFIAEIYGQKEGATPSPESELRALKLALMSAEPEEALELVDRIRELTLQIQGKEQAPPAAAKPDRPQPSDAKSDKPPQKEKPQPPKEQSPPMETVDEGFVDYIVSKNPHIKNHHAYRAKVKRLLIAGEFVGAEEYMEGYQEQKTKSAIANHLKGGEIEINGYIHKFDGGMSAVRYNSDRGWWEASFGGHSVQVSPQTVKTAIEKAEKQGVDSS
jgi:hypothetical protein